MEKRRKKANAFPSALDVQKMRDDNRRMEIDIYLMTREVDGFDCGRSKPLLIMFITIQFSVNKLHLAAISFGNFG